MCKIRFIVDVVSSAFDSCGNRQHFATLTSTLTGKMLKVRDLSASSNMRGLMLHNGLRDINFPAVYTSEASMALRAFADAAKQHAKGAVYEHEVTAGMLAALEVSE